MHLTYNDGHTEVSAVCEAENVQYGTGRFWKEDRIFAGNDGYNWYNRQSTRSRGHHIYES